MIERLDCISVFRELPSITYLRARLLATHNPHSIPNTIRRVYLPSPVLPFTDQDSLSTQKRFMDFPLPIFSVCAPFLVSAAPYQLRAWAQRQIVSPPAYIVCDTEQSFDCEHFEHFFYLDIITCSVLNLLHTT